MTRKSGRQRRHLHKIPIPLLRSACLPDEEVQSLRREEAYRLPSRRTLAASLAQLGRLDEACREAEMFMTIRILQSANGLNRSRFGMKRHVGTLLTAIARRACRSNACIFSASGIRTRPLMDTTRSHREVGG